MLRLDRLPQPEEGRLAFFVGHTDLTSLFVRTERGFVYDPAVLPLPAGEADITVYLVASGGAWTPACRRIISGTPTVKASASCSTCISNPSSNPIKK